MDHKEPWLSVPQFGEWEQKGVIPDYSMDFSKMREMRKQNKKEPSIENELISSTTSSAYHQNNSPTGRRSFFSYFNCCVKA